jgi:hypothetical protein
MSATLALVALDSTGHAGGRGQVRMIRRYIIWRSNHAYGERLRRIVRGRRCPDAASGGLRHADVTC